jgi:hypothetical protein
MLLRVPDYYDKFHCLAGACPHTCCAGWEVVIDPETAAEYCNVSGPLGDRLRRSLTRREGELCFSLEEGRCPFLQPDGLCRVYRELGEEHLSRTCRAHPRFTEEFGALRETSLAASCPAVTELLLGSGAPLTFPQTETEEPAAPWTDEWVPPLLECRERAFELLRDRSRPLRERAAWFLLFCNDAQVLLDESRPEDLTALCADWADVPETLEPELSAGRGIFPHALRVLEGLEHLDGDWNGLLRQAERSHAVRCTESAGERILCYFVFRHFLKAVTDGDLLSRAELAVFCLLVVERLSGVCGLEEALRRCCRELEHSPENLAALQAAFCGDLELGLGNFFSELLGRQADTKGTFTR